MDGRPTWTDCDEAGDYVVPNLLSPRNLVSRPDNMDETVPHTHTPYFLSLVRYSFFRIFHTFEFLSNDRRINVKIIHNSKIALSRYGLLYNYY